MQIGLFEYYETNETHKCDIVSSWVDSNVMELQSGN